MLNGQSEQGRREADRGQQATEEELGSEREIFPIEKGCAVRWSSRGGLRVRMPRALARYFKSSSDAACCSFPKPKHAFYGAWVPPLEDDACHDEHLHTPILRSAWVPPLEDGACHDEHLQQ